MLMAAGPQGAHSNGFFSPKKSPPSGELFRLSYVPRRNPYLSVQIPNQVASAASLWLNARLVKCAMEDRESMPSYLAIQASLSIPRMGTYTIATQRVPHAHGAIALYSWNAQISAAFIYPLHMCEVVIRNAVSEALTVAHGPRWPWDQGFLLSLPQPAGQHLFRPRDAVMSTADKARVVPEVA